MVDTWYVLVIYGFTLGVFAGFMGGTLSALAGLGGGIVYVPVFYFLLPVQQQAMAMYVMMSLIAVCITSGFSSRAHWCLGHVQIHKALLVFLVLGASLGLWMTLQWPAWLILFLMAMLNAWLALDMFNIHEGQSNNIPSLLGLPVGWMSGSLGIGGGTMLVPLLRRSMPLRFAVGTSVFCGTVMSLMAVFINVFGDVSWHALLAPQAVLVLSTLLGVVVALKHTTQWASKIHQRYSELHIRRVLQIFFSLLSLLLLWASIYRYMAN